MFTKMSFLIKYIFDGLKQKDNLR